MKKNDERNKMKKKSLSRHHSVLRPSGCNSDCPGHLENHASHSVTEVAVTRRQQERAVFMLQCVLDSRGAVSRL